MFLGIAGVGIIGLGIVLFLLLFTGTEDDRGESWVAGRRRSLEAIAKRLMDYAAAHGNRFPKDSNALVAAGIVASGEFRFEDNEKHVEVLRQYRPAPPIKDSTRVIVIIETYEPNPDNFVLVVYSDGEVGARAFLETTVADDNLLRGMNSLPSISWKAP